MSPSTRTLQCRLTSNKVRRQYSYGHSMFNVDWISINVHNFIKRYMYLSNKKVVDQKTSPYLVWPLFASCSATHLDQAIDCGLWNVVPLFFNGCCEVAGYWQELEHVVMQVDPEHPKHAQWVTCLVSMPAMEELGHSRNCCILRLYFYSVYFLLF